MNRHNCAVYLGVVVLYDIHWLAYHSINILYTTGKKFEDTLHFFKQKKPLKWNICIFFFKSKRQNSSTHNVSAFIFQSFSRHLLLPKSSNLDLSVHNTLHQILYERYYMEIWFRSRKSLKKNTISFDLQRQDIPSGVCITGEKITFNKTTIQNILYVCKRKKKKVTKLWKWWLSCLTLLTPLQYEMNWIG